MNLRAGESVRDTEDSASVPDDDGSEQSMASLSRRIEGLLTKQAARQRSSSGVGWCLRGSESASPSSWPSLE